ncbi:MAG: DUF885 domain-containing protein [Polyangiaceae bacterium]|nr:DUF885 domain-containing protein [Polyangiaceae bacterium]
MKQKGLGRFGRWVWVASAIGAGCGPASGPSGPAPVEAPPVAVAPPASAPIDAAAIAAANAETTKRFDALTERFLNESLRRNPVLATISGEHRYDGAWPDVSEGSEAAETSFWGGLLGELDAIGEGSLDPQRRVDATIVRNRARYALFALASLRESERNPLYYTGTLGEGFDPLVSRSFAPPAERLQSLASRLGGVPAFLTAARKRLGRPPRVHTETAIEQTRGLIALCESGLKPHFGAVAGWAEAAPKAAEAAKALKEFQAFLEKELLPRSDGNFRLGAERFEQKLRLELDDELDAGSLAAEARRQIEVTQAEMAVTAKELWPSLMKGKPLPPDDTPERRKALVATVLRAISDDRPTNQSIVAEAKKTLEEATAFVKARDLVRLPEEPCAIIEMPEYRRGVAIAYCDSSGPLEPKPETFYAIAPTPKGWSPKRVESFYREYNRSMLLNLTVHEAMPGHFLQLMHNNRFASKLRAVYSSGAFVEGWAVYGEWLMAENGFGGPKVKLMRQKMMLRTAANAVLDQGIHAGSMSEAEALALMKNEAFQEEGEAVGKWRRARLTSAQLSTYFYGFREMMKARKLVEKEPGFTERSFHDKLLGSGSPPPRHLRTLLGR